MSAAVPGVARPPPRAPGRASSGRRPQLRRRGGRAGRVLAEVGVQAPTLFPERLVLLEAVRQ
ncbi:hypothetical protein OG301_33025 [Streptomyces platensis]|uniref:hypothetical protein n=1 Tax=Streptomyces platensis TaxID=58346 RepID=UPI002ED64C3F|nr:hypothetical protein OG301_33025 [Streptomyces platensis]